MKVCILSKHFHPYSGGLEARVLELARWLVEHGDEVLVFTSHEDDTVAFEVFDGVNVRRSNVWFTLFNALFTPGVAFNLMRADFDLIDVNLPDPVNSVSAYIGSLLKRRPLFVTYHADIVKEGLIHAPFKLLYHPLLRLILKRAKRVFVTSPNYAESSPVLADFMDKVVVAPSFVDITRFNPENSGSKVRVKHKLGDKPVVLFVGRLVEYKGVNQLLGAFKELVVGRESYLLIAGDGPLRQELEAEADALGITNSVVFTGRVGEEELPLYYAACDVFVLPSVTRQEAFGLVLVEAMASGKPVVSTNFSGMPYVVGDAGLLVEPGDPIALYKALEDVLGDRALASELGGRGRKRVLELFQRDVVCAAIKAVYKSTVHKN
jgi:glycosyltransferase involved in cell wall biosynthesis